MTQTRTALSLFALLLLLGCATPPSRFYVLTAQSQAGPEPPAADLTLGVGPVRLVPYLERPQIVARERGNRLKIEEFDRWGGTLEASVTWVMAENLSRSLGTDAVVTFPWERAVTPDYQVAIDVRQFDAAADGQVRLIAQWRILGDDGRRLYTIGRSDIREPLSGQGFESQVAAQSRALARMSDEIAAALRELRASSK